MKAKRPKVIYVMGAGRSGSTILGVTLGSCDGVCYAGELDAWLARSGEPNFKNAERAEFWGRVAQRMGSGEGLFGDSVGRLIERSIAVFPAFNREQLRDLEESYRRVSAALYEAIASESRAEVVVDSSHFPLRARQLQKIQSVDLHLLYLVRRPEGVVAAFRRQGISQPPKGVVAANAYLSLTYLLSILVFMRHPRRSRLLVRYEDFVDDPAAATRQILGMAGLRPTAVPSRQATLSTGIAFQGNRLLGRDRVVLQAKREEYSVPQRLRALPQLPWRLVPWVLRPRFSSRRS